MQYMHGAIQQLCSCSGMNIQSPRSCFMFKRGWEVCSPAGLTAWPVPPDCSRSSSSSLAPAVLTLGCAAAYRRHRLSRELQASQKQRHLRKFTCLQDLLLGTASDPEQALLHNLPLNRPRNHLRNLLASFSSFVAASLASRSSSSP